MPSYPSSRVGIETSTNHFRSPHRSRSAHAVTRVVVLTAAFLLAACAPTAVLPCGIDAGEDAGACGPRLLIGPILLDSLRYEAAGGGVTCASVGAVGLRVHVFDIQHRLLQVVDTGCDSNSNFIEVTGLGPGRYLLAVESTVTNTNGAHLLVGAELIRSTPCTGPSFVPAFCRPLVAELRGCDRTIVSASLSCEDTSMECPLQ